MARCRDDPQLEAAGGQHVAVAQVVVAAPHRAHPGAGELGEPRGRLGMVVVPVGEHRLGHPGAALLDDAQHGGEVALVERAGVDDDGLVEPGSSSTQVLVPSRVIGPGLGASTQCARGVTSPPAQGAVTDGGGVAVTCPSMPWPATQDGLSAAYTCSPAARWSSAKLSQTARDCEFR